MMTDMHCITCTCDRVARIPDDLEDSQGDEYPSPLEVGAYYTLIDRDGVWPRHMPHPWMRLVAFNDDEVLLEQVDHPFQQALMRRFFFEQRWRRSYPTGDEQWDMRVRQARWLDEGEH